MPWYPYACPDCGFEFDEEWPMGEAPPKSDCLRCPGRASRQFVSVPVQYKSPGFTKSLRDRPDERLHNEIKHSQDFDVTTGKSWEEEDKELERLHAEGVLDKEPPGQHPYGVVK